MAAGTHHEIVNLQTGPGELSFDARIAGVEERVWFRSETATRPYAEAALATCLLPAMSSGGPLQMSEPVSPRVLRTQREFQAIQRAWSLSWPFGDPPLEEVEVTAPVRPAQVRQPVGRVAAFFSGGVDSWATVLENPELTDLIFVRGVDILPRLAHQDGLADQVETRLRAAADELGLRLHTVETNLRDLFEANGPAEPLIRWEAAFGCAMVAVALFLGREFDRVLIAGDSDYEVQPKIGANWMVDQLWSNEDLEIVDAGGRLNRAERTKRIASHPLVQRTLRVCWQNPEGAYNCGRCRKCLTTMATLEAFGQLEAVETLPSELDLEALAAAEIDQPALLSIWEDLLDATRRSGKPELEAAVAAAVRDGKGRLGLPPSYRSRSRSRPGARPSGNAGDGPRLLAEPDVADELAAAPAVAILVGSYDGSGNYGDIAQLDAALGLLDRFGSDLLVLPMVERRYAATHEAMASELVHRPRQVLYFYGGTGPRDEGLVPVELPGGAPLAISYLYGGGFLNPSWGERKLAMLSAVEDLVSGASRVVRIASGQQLDAGWIDGLAPAGLELLQRFELWGARDDASLGILAGLGTGAAAFNSGDDSVGILAPIGAAEAPEEPASPLEVNVHIAEHGWVTDRPDAVREFDVRLLAELSRLAGRPLRVRPLLAYLDPRIDERWGLKRFAASCAEHGIELTEPCVLRPTGIAELAGELGRAALTVSSSYHVALTSLLLAVPAAILRDNEYYAQKAQGLLSDFELPPEFSPRSSDDPEVAAAAIAPHLLDPDLRAQMRRGLETAASRVRQRRTETEERVLAQITREMLIVKNHRSAAPPRDARQELTLAETPTQRIADLRREPGELSFEARIGGGEPQRVWFRSETEVMPSADAALAACVMPAMRNGGVLEMEEPVSPQMLRSQREYQAIQRAWSYGWNYGEEPLLEVEVEAPARDPEPAPATGRVASFFSGGVDSFAAILANPEITDLIFVRGVDILPRLAHQDGLADEVEASLRRAAAELGKDLHVVETNVRDLSDPLIRWEPYFACPLVAIAHFFAPLFDRVLIAGDTDYETQPLMGAALLVDQLWSSEEVEIVDWGGRLNREQRVELIADHPVVRRTLRTCWENLDGAYNCGRCRKCLLTMVSLEAIGAREKVTAFPPGLDLSRLAGDELNQPIALALWEDLLDHVRDRGRADLAPPLEEFVERGRRTIGLSQSHRMRPSRHGRHERGTGAKLEATEAELATVLESRSWKLTEPLRRLGTRLRERRAR